MEDKYKKMMETEDIDSETQKQITKYKQKFTEDEGPFAKAGILSLASFSWMNPMFRVSPR